MKAEQLRTHGDLTRTSRPSPSARRHGSSPAIAVVSDGSALTDAHPAVRAAATESLLGDWAAVIRDQAGLIARPLNLLARNADDPSPSLRALPQDVRGVIVVGTDPAHCGAVGIWAADRQCVMVTDREITAVAAAAELLTFLSRRGLPPSRSRVLIAGAASCPLLRGLLVAAGVSEVISWDRRDTAAFPLHHVIPHAGIVIDLVGCSQELADAACEHPDLIVMTPDGRQPPTGTLPSVLHAMVGGTHSVMSVAGYYSCLMSLVAGTPPDQPGHHARGGLPWRQRSLRRTAARGNARGIREGERSETGAGR